MPEETKKQDILLELTRITDFENYVIGQEKHQDAGTYFHVLLVARNKFDTRNPNLFDIEYQGKTYHGNYEPAKYWKRIIEYVCKENDYETDIDEIVDGKLMNYYRSFHEMAEKEGIDTAAPPPFPQLGSPERHQFRNYQRVTVRVCSGPPHRHSSEWWSKVEA